MSKKTKAVVGVLSKMVLVYAAIGGLFYLVIQAIINAGVMP